MAVLNKLEFSNVVIESRYNTNNPEVYKLRVVAFTINASSYHINQPSIEPNISLTTNNFTFVALIAFLIAMAFQMPSFLSRFLRPFASSASMPLQPDALAAAQFPPTSQRAIFAGGCFWGLEELYRKDWGNKGLLDCRVGYTGGQTKAPSYYDVCSGRTGHAESLLIVFDPERVTYRQLCEYFFKMHDPTTLNRQGADTGTQYRSAVYAENDEQMQIAQEIKEKVGEQWYKGKPITTEIKRATQWYDAEPNHQKYLLVNTGGYHCPAHYVRPLPELK
ncbi:Peptide methionine sulfoxide reductase [Exophiala sideris]|uniref:peptide-methionine (S)-S-oxide reductase n=2 Tax=Exophiala sideris TaxID=1016849 RepID=A0ABR0J0V6_9EURO|nr:Peptide methionine sulfoxide reductase [Exophiala sideris]KAK5026399.1 Peptide methionine sulfoxide reductase [Exophiala sideris]KAK5052334.1 Peptide methionine sulfoxide reductase [Exophiala sideris]KAK5177361.1 Peptide methionine sulfoxide reductase [Eurotiomycetes sp. CCFEE 6388]